MHESSRIENASSYHVALECVFFDTQSLFSSLNLSREKMVAFSSNSPITEGELR